METDKFIQANNEYNSFKEELKELFTKYRVTIKERDSYRQDEYMGIELYFILDGECLYRDTVEELISKLIN